MILRRACSPNWLHLLCPAHRCCASPCNQHVIPLHATPAPGCPGLGIPRNHCSSFWSAWRKLLSSVCWSGIGQNTALGSSPAASAPPRRRARFQENM